MSHDRECDVLIVGTGAAALTAGLAASAAGLDTVIIEKTASIGGTSALSAAGLWVPANHIADAHGLADSPEEALAYIRELAPPGWEATEGALWQRFAVEAPQMLAFVEQNTPLRFELTPQSDPFPAASGGKAKGRMVSPRALPRSVAGRHARRLRPPMLPHIFTFCEYLRLDPYHHPLGATLRRLPWIVWRYASGRRGMGTALVAGLLAGCLKFGCRVETGTRAVRLLVNEAGSIDGAEIRCGEETSVIRTKIGVVLGTGGFEWDRKRLAAHFPGPIDFITSPPGNEGDGHRMAEEIGAQMAHMDQANLTAALPIVYEKRLQGISLAFHQEPNAIVVDRNGRRFTNELRFNIGEIIDERDAKTGLPQHLPAWIVTDARFPHLSPMTRWFSRHDRRWLVTAPTLASLAEKTGLPPGALEETVRRFNGFYDQGDDADFGRGRSGQGHYHSPATPLMRIEHAPFMAMPFNRSFISTKGGPRTNADAEVLRQDGSVIRGLFCVGVGMANPIGTWAVGMGTTLGPNMTWGYIAGQTLAQRAKPTTRGDKP